MIPVNYVAAARDHSGYGAASRAYIDALSRSGEVDLSLQVCSFEAQKVSHGPIDKMVNELEARRTPHKIQIIHLTPENYPLYRKKGKYNIAYTVWETDQLPPQWVEICNTMSEIWVPSQWNIDIFKSSGVTVPITCIPHIISVPDTTDVQPLEIATPSTFVFYSIFQWVARKNGDSLLKAYLTEFAPEDNVVLALKTYRLNTSPQEQEAIKREILHIKSMLRLEKYPPLLFFGNLMSHEHIAALHTRGDCYVAPSRAEGFGIPIAEAMSYKKPVIASNYSGNTDFTTEKNSYLINCDLTPVYGMIFKNYYGWMNWGAPSIQHLKEQMRYVYTHQEEARQTGKKGYQTIATEFNKQVIGKLMVDRLKQISGGKI